MLAISPHLYKKWHMKHESDNRSAEGLDVGNLRIAQCIMAVIASVLKGVATIFLLKL